MILLIFEDQAYENFLPLTYTRPVYDLKCGMYTFRERIEKRLKEAGVNVDKVFLASRDYLTKVLKRRNEEALVNEYDKVDDEVLMVNGRLFLDEEKARELLKKLTSEGMIIQKGEILALRVKESTYNEIKEYLRKMKVSNIINSLKGRIKVFEVNGYKVFDYPWEVVIENTEILKEDIIERMKIGSSEELPEKVSVVGDKDKGIRF